MRSKDCEFVSTGDEIAYSGAQAVARVQCWKSFLPSCPHASFPSFPVKWFRTDGTTTFVFSDSLDLTC